MERINSDIASGQFKKIYLLFGEESFLVHQFKDNMKNALIRKGDNMNVAFYEGASFSIDELSDFTDTMPFLAERRVVFVDDSMMVACEDKRGEALAEYIKNMPDTACIVMCEQKVDKRSKLYKTIDKEGRAIEFERLKTDTLYKWIGKRLKDEGVMITKEAAELFVKCSGDDMQILSRELEKLICYVCPEKKIYPEDVRAICTVQISDRVFDMINAVAEHNRGEALRLYDDLLALKTPPLKILALLSSQFNKLYQVWLLKRDGLGPDAISSAVGLRAGYITKLYMQRSAAFGGTRLKEAVFECVDLEERVKKGMMNDRMAVELILIKYSEK